MDDHAPFFININTDPTYEFIKRLKVKCTSAMSIKKTSGQDLKISREISSNEFSIDVSCTNNINVNVAPGLIQNQEYDATTVDSLKSKFIFSSFETTTSAC